MSLALPLALALIGVAPVLWWLHRRARPEGDRVFSAFFLVRGIAGAGRRGPRVRAPGVLALRVACLVCLAVAAAGPSGTPRGGTLVLAAGPFEPDPAWRRPLVVVRAGAPPTIVSEGDVVPVAGPPDWGGALQVGRSLAPTARVVRPASPAPAAAIVAGGARLAGAEVIVTAVTVGVGRPTLVSGGDRVPMRRRAGDWIARGALAGGPAHIELEGARPWPICLPDTGPLRVADAGWPPAVAAVLTLLPGVEATPAAEAHWRPGPVPPRRRGWAAFAPQRTWFEFGVGEPTETTAPLIFAGALPPPGAVARRFAPLVQVAEPVLFAGDAPVVDVGSGPAGDGWRFGFAVADADLPDTAGWPVLFLDAAERARARHARCRVHPAGESLVLAHEGAVAVTDPDGARREVKGVGGAVVLDGLDRQGMFTLEAGGVQASVAVVPPIRASAPSGAAFEGPRARPTPTRWPFAAAALVFGVGLMLASRRLRAPTGWLTILLLGAALPDLRLPGAPGAVVVAVDTSGSMPPEATRAALAAVRAGLPRAAQVEGAEVVHRVGDPAEPQMRTAGTRHGPLLGAAARLAGVGGVVVLISDGRALDGPAPVATPVVVVPAAAGHADARVVRARALRLGGQVFVHATLAASAPTAAVVHLGPASTAVRLGPGERTVQAVMPAGPSETLVWVDAPDDPQPANDRLPVPVEGGAPAQAVVVGPGAVGWAESAGLDAREVPAAGLAEVGGRLGLARAMFVHDQPAGIFDAAVIAGLGRWVAAGGVLVLGGRAQAFGPGGWAGTPLEALSPLRSDPRQDEGDTVAVSLVLDRSGSMAVEAGGIGPAAVAQLAARVAGALSPRDHLSVVAFGMDAEALLAPTTISTLATDGLRAPTLARGGTRLAPALALARRHLDAVPARRRVAVLVSDGRFVDAEGPALTRELDALRAADIRVVAVLTGEDPDKETLTRLARHTGGSVNTVGGEAVTRFTTAKVLEAGGDGLFAEGGPVVPGGGWAARAGGQPPAVPRRVRVRAHPEARVLATAGGEPLLAEWALGQGRVIALATDRWSLSSDQWAALLAPASAPRPADGAIRVEGEVLAFEGAATDPAPGGVVRILGSQGEVSAAWHPVGPGRAVAPLPPGPVEVLTVSSPSARGAVLTRVARPPPAELQATGIDRPALALQAEITGGQVATAQEAAAVARVLLGRRRGRPLAPWLLVLAALALLWETLRWSTPAGLPIGRRR